MNTGTLGPQQSYSEKATRVWLGLCDMDGENIHFFADIPDVFTALDGGNIDVGIVPVENSIEGSVGVTLDLLLEKDVSIIGGVVVPISHCLISKGKVEDIQVILSHPHALAQCRQFLRENFPNAELRTTGSTSHAARLATEFNEMAAIASESAASTYGLDVLLSGIQDWDKNETRFVVMVAGKNKKCLQVPQKVPNNTKTSLIIYLDSDRPGALYEILKEFATRDINLTRIESRPSKRSLGDYLFYIDLEGTINDANINDAINQIGKKTKNLKMLGSYGEYLA
ncbi:prephenate dehydratase [Methanohalophilus levihalophilus]|uniref:prephenate dehydratase n=1 Tax=Methanohalophilus levihalophilus TaxID=1431282 RepID=UPI001AE89280|nr:prephenate dehydratase [Methanohalophilus levihalophilus]MBP2029592.1 prephenate dehydratase [Methanohalophilus levihalophilus]